MRKYAQDSDEEEFDELLEEVLPGESVSSAPTTNSHQEAVSSTNEIYQLPVRVGQGGVSLEDGGKPWIVGYFSPHAPTDYRHTHHDGLDLRAPKGTPIFSLASGIVIEIGTGQKSGPYIKVGHEQNRVVSFYAHCNEIVAQKGQEVTQKTIIAYVGDRGNAIGVPHAHVEVKVNGILVNLLSIVGKPVGSLSKNAHIKSLIYKLSEVFYVNTKNIM